jgi:predicted metal-dependent HD superfamily phosphohydrolase
MTLPTATGDLPHSQAFRASWQRCWTSLARTGDGAAVRDELLRRHAEPHRKYHTLQHLRECLEWCERAAHLAEQPAEVELALWFHDAVYVLRGAENEWQSAELARASLQAGGASPEAIAPVAELVLATRHTALPVLPDAQLLVDIDLAILGAPEQRFAEYEAQIRDEYAFVPQILFKPKRRKILASFLARERIYSTPFFFEALERQARLNLGRAVA